MFLADHFWGHLIYSESYRTSTENIFQHQTVNRKNTSLWQSRFCLWVTDFYETWYECYTNSLHLKTKF